MTRHSVRKPSGQVIVTGEFGPVQQRDTLMCVHCNRHWVVQPGSGIQRGWCSRCSGPTCGSEPCHTCTPFEWVLDQIEQKASRDYRLGL